MEAIFRCQKCGTCCRNLVKNVGNVTIGLFLTSKETHLFPSKLIFPQISVGVNKPEKTIAYQLNVYACPHINDKNECMIYDKRPLVCKSFPLEITPIEVIMHRECPVIAVLVKEGEARRIGWSAVEIKANQKIRMYMSNRYERYFKVGLKAWTFDLRSKEWIRTSK